MKRKCECQHPKCRTADHSSAGTRRSDPVGHASGKCDAVAIFHLENDSHDLWLCLKCIDQYDPKMPR